MLQPTWTAKRDVVKFSLTTCCAARTDQDTVPRSGKFGIMYKRPGQRVLINSDGDMIVRILSSRQTQWDLHSACKRESRALRLLCG